MILRRRGLLGAIAGLITAPAIVKAEMIMPVKVQPTRIVWTHGLVVRTSLPMGAWRKLYQTDDDLFGRIDMLADLARTIEVREDTQFFKGFIEERKWP
jgi:hypothetical protein